MALAAIDLERQNSLLRRASGFIGQAVPRFTLPTALKNFFKPAEREAFQQREAEMQEEECTICLSYEYIDCQIRQCSHKFCRACIEEWLNLENNTCPNCRRAGITLADLQPLAPAQRGRPAQPRQSENSYALYEHIQELTQNIVREYNYEALQSKAQKLRDALTEDLLETVDVDSSERLRAIKNLCEGFVAKNCKPDVFQRLLNSQDYQVVRFSSNLMPGQVERQQERRASPILCHEENCRGEIEPGETYYCCNLCFKISHPRCSKYGNIRGCNNVSCAGILYEINEDPVLLRANVSRSVDELKEKHPLKCERCSQRIIGGTQIKYCYECNFRFCQSCSPELVTCRRCKYRLRS